MAQKPGLPEGTRDFGPEQVRKRTWIFDTIRQTFALYGFQPLETPAMENLSTLTGKYGEEGDRLLFKILNNGDFLKDVDPSVLASGDSSRLLRDISKRGLRYDLTVPFARYVVMNRHNLTFPFKRYQIQPVWRADRPQKGRYREFYQCDADVIGSESLLYEAELIQIYDQVFHQLRIPVQIHLNNRKILFGIAEACGITDQFVEMTTSIDKLDKIGMEGVRKELLDRHIPEAAVSRIEQMLASPDLGSLRISLENSPEGLLGIQEVEQVMGFLEGYGMKNTLTFDPTLARGLTYYTGCIIEVSATSVQMGSLGGGGRYADLTGVFGVAGLSGVGISFGADRIYDVAETLGVFPDALQSGVQVLLAAFDQSTQQYAFRCAYELRTHGISVEVYPEPGKLKKPFEYASKKNIPWVGIAGASEMAEGVLMFKDQRSGNQTPLRPEDFAGQWRATQA
jgi:histidyl-tRNA synthetase